MNKKQEYFRRQDYFVSTVGNDRWSGKLPEPNSDRTDGPFATIERARDAVREDRKRGNFQGEVTVWLRGGTYHVSKPIIFTPDDSAPVLYTSYPDEQAMIDGGKRLDGWQEINLNGIVAWVTEVPEVAAGKWYFRDLYVNGQRRSRTRLPKSGYYWIEDVPGVSKTAALFDGSDSFICAPGDINKWSNMADVEVVVLHYWIEERMPVASYDESTRTVRSSRRSIFALKDDVAERYARYYVENVFEALSEPGEWYLDRNSGKLFYIPLPGESMESCEFVAPAVEQLVVLKGNLPEGKYVEFIRFKNLVFQHTDWSQPEEVGKEFRKPGVVFAAAPQAASNVPGVIYLEGARFCCLENCIIRHTGWYAVEISDGCTGIRVVGNDIYDTGAGGIKIGGADASEPDYRRTGNNRITENHIYSGGRVFFSAVGVLSIHSFGNVISHNHIHDYYYTGISCGWVWGYGDNVSRDNCIEKNHIHDIGHGLLSDMGGIYTLGVQPGTVIRNNLIHDIEKRNYGGWGIYLDEGSSHIIVENNIVYNTSSQGFHQHYGRENIIRNNIFAFGREGQVAHGRAEAHVAFTFERNILVTDGAPLFVGGYAGQLEKRNFVSDLNMFYNITGGNLISGNHFYDKDGKQHLKKLFTLDEWRALGYDLHSIAGDPGFKDVNNFNFALDNRSQALLLGFKPIDMSDVGPGQAGSRE